EKGGARATLRVRVELRLFVQHAIECKDYGVRIERRAIVELHALPQCERPSQVVVGARPGGGESGDGVRRGGALPGVPVEQAVVDVHAHEAHALTALSYELVRDRDVTGRHGDAQRAAVPRRILLSSHVATLGSRLRRGLIRRLAATATTGAGARDDDCSQHHKETQMVRRPFLYCLAVHTSPFFQSPGGGAVARAADSTSTHRALCVPAIEINAGVASRHWAVTNAQRG